MGAGVAATDDVADAVIVAAVAMVGAASFVNESDAELAAVGFLSVIDSKDSMEDPRLLLLLLGGEDGDRMGWRIITSSSSSSSLSGIAPI